MIHIEFRYWACLFVAEVVVLGRQLMLPIDISQHAMLRTFMMCIWFAALVCEYVIDGVRQGLRIVMVTCFAGRALHDQCLNRVVCCSKKAYLNVFRNGRSHMRAIFHAASMVDVGA